MPSPLRLSARLTCLFSAAILFNLSHAAFAQNADAPKPAEAAAATAPAATVPNIENAVVKVFSTLRHPDPYKPWTKQAPSEVTGSGVIIEGKRILTNAHVVLYASQVQVQANQAGDKISATVEFIAPGIDLAVLKLDDETFFDTRPPVARASALPEIKDAVLAYGYPTGGTSLSITKGIVSRIEFTSYNFPVSGLRIQIDAAINPGNSGGPAVVGDKMIGLAYSHLGGGTQRIGYIIPNEEIELFLADIADGKYDGKPAIYDELQTLENSALRAYLKLDKSVEGIVVHQPYQPETSPLKEWDVITKIGDTRVDDQGMIKVGTNLRVRFAYMVQKIAKDGKVPLTVVRNSHEVAISLPVSSDRPMLVPDLHGEYPPYFIFGPVAFSRATVPYVAVLNNNAPLLAGLSMINSPLVTRRGDSPAFPGEELVIISSPFFPHKLAKGYGNSSGSVVRTVNGVPVKNLRHLVELLRDSKDEFITIESSHRGGETLVFPRKEMVAATDEILSDNGVRAQGSADMLAVWNAKAPAK